MYMYIIKWYTGYGDLYIQYKIQINPFKHIYYIQKLACKIVVSTSYVP